ncbi:MAG TPA: glycosyltransferase [Solirubrobacteraceae bacterium]|nr:glycosyltransferase [Solirubrobacteraceae bacterium]
MPAPDVPAAEVPAAEVPAPEVSVVVSSYERPESLARLLEALAGQSLGADRFEVIVVDNGSGPATAAALDRIAARSPLRLNRIRHERTLGPAGGRNSGWRAARAPLIAFTDDDCRPLPGWLAGLLRAHAAGPRPGELTIVQGRTDPDPADLARLRRTLWARVVSVQAADGRYETCNILYPRTLLQRLGGFDDSLLPRGLRAAPVGEDTDLGWRARALGARAVFAADALVHHEVVDLGPWGKLAHTTRWAGAVHLFRLHPAAREILFRRLFWNVWHYMLLRALLSLAGPRWLSRLLLTRYLRAMRGRAAECGAGTWAVPYLVLEDLLECVALAGASLQERTAVL